MPTLDEQIVLAISADITNLRRAVVQMGGVVKEMADQQAKLFEGIGTSADRSADKVANAAKRQANAVKTSAESAAAAAIRAQEKASAYAANNARNLSFQINDVISALASGQGVRGVAQQFGQIAQSFSGTGIKATLGAMLTSTNLITLALTAAGAAATYFFTDVESGAKKAAEAQAKLTSAIKDITGEYGALNTEAEKTLKQFVFQREIAAGLQKIADQIKAVRDEAKGMLQPIIDDIPLLARDHKINLSWDQQDTIINGLTDISKALDAGQPGLKEAAALLTQLDDMTFKDPQSGAGILAERLKQVVDRLKDGWTAEQALREIMDDVKKSQIDTIENQKKFTKALEDMKGIAAPALTDMARLMKAYDEAVKAAAGDMKLLADAQAALEAGMQRIADQSFGLLAGADLKELGDYADRVAQAESGGDPNAHAPVGSASGLYQFTNETFYRTAKTLREFAGLTKDEIMARKNDVAAQKLVFEKFTNDNAKILEAHNIGVNRATLYLMHFLGPGGGLTLLSAAPGESAAKVAGPAATAANPTVLGGGKTVQDVLDWAARKMGGAGAVLTTKTERTDLDAEKEKVDVLDKQNVKIDEQYAKEQAALKLIDLKAQHADDLEKGTKEDREALLASLQKEADEYGVIEAKKKAIKEQEDVEGAIERMRNENAELEKRAELMGTTLDALEANLTAEEREQALTDGRIAAMEIENSYKEKHIALTKEQTAAIEDQQQKLALAKAGIKEFGDQSKQSAKDAQQFAQQFASSIGSAISGFISDLRAGKSVGEAFNNMINRIIDSLIDMAIQMLIVKPLTQALTGFLGGGGIAGAAAALEKGGVVGQPGPTMRADPRWWIGAPSFARGGPVLPHGAVPIIAHAGETVLPKGARVGGDTINNQVGAISIDMAGTGLVTSSSEQGKLLGRQIEAAVAVVLVKESRPGGILRTQPGAR